MFDFFMQTLMIVTEQSVKMEAHVSMVLTVSYAFVLPAGRVHYVTRVSKIKHNKRFIDSRNKHNINLISNRQS